MTAIICNGKQLALPPGATVLDLLRELNLQSRPVAVELNKMVVPREQHARQTLSNGDQVEVVSLVGGG